MHCQNYFVARVVVVGIMGRCVIFWTVVLLFLCNCVDVVLKVAGVVVVDTVSTCLVAVRIMVVVAIGERLALRIDTQILYYSNQDSLPLHRTAIKGSWRQGGDSSDFPVSLPSIGHAG